MSLFHIKAFIQVSECHAPLDITARAVNPTIDFPRCRTPVVMMIETSCLATGERATENLSVFLSPVAKQLANHKIAKEKQLQFSRVFTLSKDR